MHKVTSSHVVEAAVASTGEMVHALDETIALPSRFTDAPPEQAVAPVRLCTLHNRGHEVDDLRKWSTRDHNREANAGTHLTSTLELHDSRIHRISEDDIFRNTMCFQPHDFPPHDVSCRNQILRIILF